MDKGCSVDVQRLEHFLKSNIQGKKFENSNILPLNLSIVQSRAETIHLIICDLLII